MRASTSGADASAEQVALRAALGAEGAGFAGRALVDGLNPTSLWWAAKYRPLFCSGGGLDRESRRQIEYEGAMSDTGYAKPCTQQLCSAAVGARSAAERRPTSVSRGANARESENSCTALDPAPPTLRLDAGTLGLGQVCYHYSGVMLSGGRNAAVSFPKPGEMAPVSALQPGQNALKTPK